MKMLISTAERGSGNVTNLNYTNHDCAVDFSENCIRFNQTLSLNIDISDCSNSVTDSCLVFGSMQV